jgi:hypothetical protein
MTWHQNMGHKGPVLRPRCIGTERAETQLLLYSSLLLFHGNNGFKCASFLYYMYIVCVVILFE